MKLPRDLSGTELAVALRRYGYQITRQTGRHLRVGTLSAILADVAAYLEMTRERLAEDLFGR